MQKNEKLAESINGNNEANNAENAIIEVKNATIRNISLHGTGSKGRVYITIDEELDITSEDGITKGNTLHISLYSLLKSMINDDNLIFATSIVKDFTDEDWNRRKDNLNTTIKKLMLLNTINVKYQIVPAGGNYVDINTGEIKASPYSYDTIFYTIEINKVFPKNILYADSI